jgi:metallopeptidase MepB
VLYSRFFSATDVGCYFLVGVYGVETPPQPPIVFNLSVDDVHNIGDYVIAQDKAVFNHILSTVAPDNASFENTIAPWAHHSDEVNTLIAPLYYITDTAAHNATNDFYHARGPVLTNISTSDGFFALIKAVYDDLDSQDKLWTPEGALTVFYYQPRVDAGLSVAKGSQRAKYTSLVDQQLNLSRAWDANAYNPAQTTSLYFSPEELDGVDTQTLATFSNGTGVNEGKLEVIVDYDGYSVMSSAKSQRVRQEVDIASNRLAKDNVDILKQAYAGRDEMAQLLGYPDFATARLQNTIAGSTEAALALINEIKDTLKPKATDQVDQLDSIIKQENASSKAYRWDINYAGDAIDEAQTNLTDDNFDGYFVAKYTVPLALQQFGQAFGFDLQLLEGADLNTLSPTGKGSDILPDPNAVLYEVWSSGSNDFAGYLYSDVFTRPNKSSNGLRGISLRPSFTAANRTRYYPAALLNGGYTQDQHLDSDGLAALFWQMGVVYWTLSCESTFGDICGSSGAPTDFSQMVGQMMEASYASPLHSCPILYNSDILTPHLPELRLQPYRPTDTEQTLFLLILQWHRTMEERQSQYSSTPRDSSRSHRQQGCCRQILPQSHHHPLQSLVLPLRLPNPHARLPRSSARSPHQRNLQQTRRRRLSRPLGRICRSARGRLSRLQLGLGRGELLRLGALLVRSLVLVDLG